MIAQATIGAIASSAFGWKPSDATSATLRGWYEVRADLVTLASGDVAQINNRIAGGANPLVESTVGAQPLFEAAGWGTASRDSLLFDGVGDVLHADGLAAYATGTDQPFTVLLLAQVLTLGSTSDTRAMWVFGNTGTDVPGQGLQLPATTSAVQSSIRRDDGSVAKVRNAATALTTSRAMTSFVFNGSKSKLWVNGVLDTNLDGAHATTADSDVGALTLDTFSVGAARRTTLFGFTHMRLGGMVVYQGALSDAEVARCERYLEIGHPL